MIVFHVKRSAVTDRVKDFPVGLLHWHIEQTLAYLMDKGRLLDALSVLGKKVRMLPNERGYRIELDFWRLKAAVATWTDEVFVTTDSASVAV